MRTRGTFCTIGRFFFTGKMVDSAVRTFFIARSTGKGSWYTGHARSLSSGILMETSCACNTCFHIVVGRSFVANSTFRALCIAWTSGKCSWDTTQARSLPFGILIPTRSTFNACFCVVVGCPFVANSTFRALFSAWTSGKCSWDTSQA